VVGGEPGREERDGVQVRLLADVAPIAVAELRGEPGATLPPPPRPGELEAFFVLAGELTLTGGDREQRARAGAWVLRPPGAAVQVAPRAPGAVRVLRLRAPGTGAG
jgi:quercetin dioxygenase-like cupin family protein